jgi:hypothetical protein
MSEAAKLIFELPVMIDGFASGSSEIPAKHRALLSDVADTLKALRFFNGDGMVFLCGETDSTGTAQVNDGLRGRRAEAVAAQLRRLGVPASMIQILHVSPTFTQPGREDATSRGVEIRYVPAKKPPAWNEFFKDQSDVDAKYDIARLPLPKIPDQAPSRFPPFTMTPSPGSGATKFAWPGLFKDEDRQTWCQNIATLITISDKSGGLGNALGGLCSPIPVGGNRDPFTTPIDQGTGLPNTVIFNLPTLHFNWP